jgi:SPP1 gp7 family putative phage head morphogenesis protein
MADGGMLRFEEAIDFLKGKVNLPARRYDDLLGYAHVRGFTVSGVVRDDMLADFKRALEKAQREGTGYQEFRKSFDEIVDRTGWKFNARGTNDEQRREWRALIIYKTNMRTSYMAGRYAQLTDPDVLNYRPYWQYVHSGALHPRKSHLALDGKVFAATDAVWDIYFPPNGFGCECDVKALSRRDLERLGKSIPDAFPLPAPYDGIDPRTGETEIRYPGVDRGWNYNGGKSWLSGSVPQELRAPLEPFDADNPSARRAELPALPLPVNVNEASILPTDKDNDFYARRFLEEFSLKRGEAKEYRDASGGLITISEDLFALRGTDGEIEGDKTNKNERGRFVKLLAMAILNPDEIWADWVNYQGSPVLRRAYIKSFKLPGKDRSVFVRFEWTSKGWVGVTAFDTRASYIEKYRKGALLWRNEQ